MNNGKICVSVCAETASEFQNKIKSGEEFADIIELRFDCLNEGEIQKFFELPSSKKMELFTFRPKEQGGKRELSVEDRLKFWSLWQTDNLWVDFEFDLFQTIIDASYTRRLTICSHHDFNAVPTSLAEIYEKMLETKADVIKIAVRTDDVTDGLPLIKLLERAKAENRELIPIAMGESGVWTRILGLSRGAFMTFAALDEESATAPGQLTAEEMIDVYRVKELDETTEIYGLVANSVAYSVSPQMHNEAFKFHKMNAVYVPFAVKKLEEFMRRMVNTKTREIDLNFRGFSVTIPHKIEIMKFLDFVDGTSRKIGAVNTVKIEGDKLLGFNTDADGFIEPLKNTYGDLNGARVAVFGAGGAARACVYALLRENASVTIFARNTEKAESLAAEFGVQIKELPIQNSKSETQNFDVIVNATPLGMKKGGLENETPATAEQLKGVGLVYDLVYNPFETRLMREASAVSVPTIGGMAMLVAQAAAQQKIWTGKNAPVEKMSTAALKKLRS
ncbi:MAG: shikimate dehydrogenase [Acidobacteriota bacterium]|nr:shikimate dehydrogenase [Acidobacteriota bacterium]